MVQSNALDCSEPQEPFVGFLRKDPGTAGRDTRRSFRGEFWAYLLPCFLGPQRTVMQHNSVTRAAVISEMTVQLTLSGGGHVCYKSRRGRLYERGSESGRRDGANYSFKLPRKGKPHSALR